MQRLVAQVEAIATDFASRIESLESTQRDGDQELLRELRDQTDRIETLVASVDGIANLVREG